MITVAAGGRKWTLARTGYWGLVVVGAAMLSFGSGDVMGAGVFVLMLLLFWGVGRWVWRRVWRRVVAGRVGRPEVPAAPATPARTPVEVAPPPAATVSPERYVPPVPFGNPVEPWGRLRAYFVVGMAGCEENILTLVEELGLDLGLDEDSLIEIDTGDDPDADRIHDYVPASLSPAQDNPPGVAVWVQGYHVGYMTAADAVQHRPEVVKFQARGETVMVEAAVDARFDGDELSAIVTLLAPAPSEYGPVNDFPTVPYVLLPPGRTVKVTGTDKHLDVIGPFLVDGTQQWAAMTLHIVTKPRDQPVVEVRLDGRPVGELTRVQTGNLKPLVEYVAARGKVPVVRARIFGNQIQPDVRLQVANTKDVDQQWLDSLGPEVDGQGGHDGVG